MPANSVLVRAIRSGPAIPEDSILLSLSASDVLPSPDDRCVNAAVPHPLTARQLQHGTARLIGNVFAHSTRNLDESVSTVGGGIVIMKMVDMTRNTEELAATLSILKDGIRDCWQASEEMERIREPLPSSTLLC